MNEYRVFARFPILQTPRLTLRELRSDDVPAAHRMFSNPEVMRYIGRPIHRNHEETREIVERNRVLFPERQGIRWAMTLRGGDDQLIGSLGHWRLIKEHHRAEVGYDLLPEFWGRGLMTEALRAVLQFGFVEMELHSTEAQIDPQNAGSRRVLDKLGFRQDGLIRENYYFNGQYTDTAIFTLLTREFLATNQTPSDF